MAMRAAGVVVTHDVEYRRCRRHVLLPGRYQACDNAVDYCRLRHYVVTMSCHYAISNNGSPGF